MPEQSGESIQLPCPSCDYDLRGQTDPHCPECGRTFVSISELRALALDVRRVFNRVLVWRIKFAIAYVLGLVWLALGVSIIGIFATGPSIGGALGLTVAFTPLIIMPLGALVFLVQVLRLKADSNIGRAQRRELNGTIPLLLIYMLPGFIFGPSIIWMLWSSQSAFGTGV